MSESPAPFSEQDRVTLVELVNRVVDRGVVLGGDITISVAEIDLLYLGLRVLLCSPEQILGARGAAPRVVGSSQHEMGSV